MVSVILGGGSWLVSDFYCGGPLVLELCGLEISEENDDAILGKFCEIPGGVSLVCAGRYFSVPRRLRAAVVCGVKA